jgi:(R,R)-butanediol dehydrogenase/meso-butanediol dehydrogenase/diacetyl reductase
VLAQAVASTCPGGTCVNVAIWGHPATFDVNSLVFSEIRLIGSLAYAGRHPDVIGLVRDGVVGRLEQVRASFTSAVDSL